MDWYKNSNACKGSFELQAVYAGRIFGAVEQMLMLRLSLRSSPWRQVALFQLALFK
jgi:hypothetical protein